jgi:molybdate transport system substrate-binding protein
VILLYLLAASPAQAAVNLFAAASTAGAMDRVATAYSDLGLGVVRVSYASSSTLAKQIVNGAPADVFVSASTAWMDYASRLGGIAPATRFDLLGNRLVLVVPTESGLSLRMERGFPLAAALGREYLAMGDPDHVPAGIYGKAALEALGMWRAVAGRVARAADVRAALALVERGEAAAGIVYRSDAKGRRGIRIVATVPQESHPPITYPTALVSGRIRPETRAFLKFMKSERATRIFVEFGFAVILDRTR